MTTPEEIEKFEEWFSFCFKDEDLPIEETILKLKSLFSSLPNIVTN